MTTPTYLYFFSGPFSNWHHSDFTIGGIKFNTVEQYLMYNKAVMFNNMEIAAQILKERHPKEQKKLGRTVKGFDKVWWEDNCLQLAFRGCHAKFTQNKKLYNMLMNTNPSILVEASKFDNIWGIGLSEDDAKKVSPEEWPGTNWLGYTLTNVRDHLLEEERIEKAYKERKAKA